MKPIMDELLRIIPEDAWISYADIVVGISPEYNKDQVRGALGSMSRLNMVSANDPRPFPQRKGKSVRQYRLNPRKQWRSDAERAALVSQPAAVLPVTTPLRAVKIGDYTINVGSWIFATDHRYRLELTVAALEYHSESRIVCNKKIVFEYEEAAQVRAWLAAQTGYIENYVAIEQERDAAIKLAEEAEARAQRAEEQLARIKRMIGGVE